MPTHSTDQIPPRKDNWDLSQEGYELITRMDYYGKEYKVWVKPVFAIDLGKAWQSFRNQFLSQPERPLTGSNSYNPNLEQIDFNNVENNSI